MANTLNENSESSNEKEFNKIEKELKEELREVRKEETELKKVEEQLEHTLAEVEKLKKIYHFFIDKVKYETTSASLSVGQILVEYAKVNPVNKTLARKEAGGFHEYKNLDEIISIEHVIYFILFDNTPTQVS